MSPDTLLSDTIPRRFSLYEGRWQVHPRDPGNDSKTMKIPEYSERNQDEQTVEYWPEAVHADPERSYPSHFSPC
jgi:hypothetical protein